MLVKQGATVTVIKKKTLNYYCSVYPSIKPAISAWYKIMKNNNFEDIVEIRKSFPTADSVAGHSLICFNLKGNSYRLIVRITWGKTVFIQELLTHADYTKKYIGRKK
jgi:mRNA interferase HigB